LQYVHSYSSPIRFLNYHTTGVCELTAFQNGQKALVSASSKSPKVAVNLADKFNHLNVTQNVTLGETGKLDFRQKAVGRMDSVSSNTPFMDFTDSKQKRGRQDSVMTVGTETSEYKQRRGRVDSVATVGTEFSEYKADNRQRRGRTDSCATAQSGDGIDLRPEGKQKRGSMELPPPTVPPSEDLPQGKVPRTLLIGDGTVEWFARILDPDGELEGDIVRSGKVAFATRKSDVRT
jgi:hypothetical protein